jgi:hypothetical protein
LLRCKSLLLAQSGHHNIAELTILLNHVRFRGKAE